MEFKVHVLLYLILINFTCDFIRLILKRLIKVTELVEDKLGLKEDEVKDESGSKFDFTKVMNSLMTSKNKLFRIIKYICSAVIFVVELILPYYLFGKFNKLTNANFENQVNSFAPFSIVTLHYPNNLQMTPELADIKSTLSLVKKDNTNVLDSTELDDGNENNGSVKEANDHQLNAVVEGKDNVAKTEEKKNDYKSLTSFNRFLSFSLSKLALSSIYISINDIISPESHYKFIKSFIKRQKV